MSVAQRPALQRTLSLDDPAARDVRVAGAKAAALARARVAGMRTVPGVVLTTAVSDAVDAGARLTDVVDDAVVAAVDGLGTASVVVRSSSVVEDGATSSAAGRFSSVLDVRGRDALLAAVDEVLGSRVPAGAADEPIAVLVQPTVAPDLAGVAFGVDPVSGRSDRRVVTAVRGSPAPLVGGEVEGSRYEVDPRGGVVSSTVREGAVVPRGLLRDVVALLDEAAEVFGGPQDVEWGRVDGRLVLLQSRPVTTTIRGVPSGPVYGPGPVAETFPEPLAPLEQDLWVPPLRQGLAEALAIAGATRPRPDRDRERPPVVVVDGRVAIDLEATGDAAVRLPSARHVLQRARRLRTVWRIGRLQAALPVVADDVLAQVDADLAEVPSLDGLTVRQLVALLERGRSALRSLHAHEILLGLVADPTSSPFTGTSVALRVLGEARQEGLADEEIVRRAPVVLVLVPPAIGGALRLPSDARSGGISYDPPAAPDAQVRREALRLRVRWVQELLAQTALEVGRRLVRAGAVSAPEHVRQLRLAEVVDAVAGHGGPTAADVARRVAAAEATAVPRLPTRFRLSDLGRPVAVHPRHEGGGTGAGGGIGTGPVTHDTLDPPPGAVLVVAALDPRLAPLLPRLAGLVCETGSVLSHLAILAREVGLPTVVGHAGTAGLVDGAVVRVDGLAGEVVVLADDAQEVVP